MKTITVKNMVCNRCIKVVKENAEKSGLKVSHVELGKLLLDAEPSEKEIVIFKNLLDQDGFELLDDKKSRIIEQIKTIIVNRVHHENPDESKTENLSDRIVHELAMEYTHLSALFSSVVGITIERFYILQKIERVKELIIYDELTLSEIAFKVGYSSVAHLSSQFKKLTGLTPGHFKELQDRNRKPLDHVYHQK